MVKYFDASLSLAEVESMMGEADLDGNDVVDVLTNFGTFVSLVGHYILITIGLVVLPVLLEFRLIFYDSTDLFWRTMDLRVVDSDLEPASGFRIVLYYVIYIMLSLCTGGAFVLLNFLVLLFSSEGQDLVNKMTGTRVVMGQP
jgi:hypothetical protein